MVGGEEKGGGKEDEQHLRGREGEGGERRREGERWGGQVKRVQSQDTKEGG